MVAHARQATHSVARLGFYLAAGIVLADLFTSKDYVPGMLAGSGAGRHAAFFVLLTTIVFVGLCWMYSEITTRYIHGGGVVNVSKEAFGSIVSAAGASAMTVDYNLTAAVSAVSAGAYLSRFIPLDKSWIAIGIIVAIWMLNLKGIKESAIVTLVFVVVTGTFEITMLSVVVRNMNAVEWTRFWEAFTPGNLGFTTLVSGYGFAYLAFSGLESIAQVSEYLKDPRQYTSKMAMTIVALVVVLTSPVVTALSTALPSDAILSNPENQDRLLGILASTYWGVLPEVLTTLSVAVMLIFAVCTAVIGQYHIQLSLVHQGNLPRWLEKPMPWFGTPWRSISIACVTPIIIILIVHGELALLGAMYAFGLLFAITLACISKLKLELQGVWEGYPRKWAVALLFALTICVGAAFLINLYYKPLARDVGGGMTLVLMAFIGLTKYATYRGTGPAQTIAQDIGFALGKLIPAWQPQTGYTPNLDMLAADPKSEHQDS